MISVGRRIIKDVLESKNYLLHCISINKLKAEYEKVYSFVFDRYIRGEA